MLAQVREAEMKSNPITETAKTLRGTKSTREWTHWWPQQHQKATEKTGVGEWIFFLWLRKTTSYPSKSRALLRRQEYHCQSHIVKNTFMNGNRELTAENIWLSRHSSGKGFDRQIQDELVPECQNDGKRKVWKRRETAHDLKRTTLFV